MFALVGRLYLQENDEKNAATILDMACVAFSHNIVL